MFWKNIQIKLLSCFFVFILTQSLNTATICAQTNAEFKMKIYGLNKVLLKHIDSFELYASIKNIGTRPIELNKSIINSEHFFQNGICWELQININDVFIPYDSIHTFNINDVNYYGIAYDNYPIRIDSLHKYVFNPFEVYTPNKSGIFRTRLINKNSEAPDNYSDWFYLHVYRRKREWKNHKD